jgi:hypothetical protein
VAVARRVANSTSVEDTIANEAKRKSLISKVNAMAEFNKEVRWEDWEVLYTRTMMASSTLLLADNEGSYFSEAVPFPQLLDTSGASADGSRKFALHAFRKCDGLRDLGNLQDSGIDTCLQRCEMNPLCRSATYSHTNKRCLLSSICQMRVAEFDARWLLFEKTVDDSSKRT